MIEHVCVYWCQAFEEMQSWIGELLVSSDQRVELDNKQKGAIGKAGFFDIFLNGHGIAQEDDALGYRIRMLRRELVQGHPFTAEGLVRELQGIRDQVLIPLGKRKFIYIPSPLSGYVDQECLFGEDVFTAFPSARKDIKESGNCFATELHTACVFHLMRVAEYGLRALAFDRRVTIPKGRPIELATWDDIIKELEKAEEAIRNYPQTLARESQYEFYHGALMQYRRFKNLFRNRVSHTRDAYAEAEAKLAFDSVREFMGILALRISEGKRTPVIWKGNKWR